VEIAMRLLLVTACLAAGCKSKSPDEAPGDDDDDDDTPTAITADTAPPEGKRVAEVRFRAFIAWDATLRRVVPPIIDGQEGAYISAYLIDLYEAGWSSSVEDSFCRVFTDLEGLGESTAALSEGYLWGLDIPEGDKPMGSDCLDKGFDPDQFTNGDPVAEWAPAGWSVRLGGTLSDELVEWLTDVGSAVDTTQYMAGDWSSTVEGQEFYTTDADNNYWYAYAMDAAHNVDFDTRLQDWEMAGGPGLVSTAYFVFDQRVYWNIEE
jgi:hypothetical protein